MSFNSLLSTTLPLPWVSAVAFASLCSKHLQLRYLALAVLLPAGRHRGCLLLGPGAAEALLCHLWPLALFFSQLSARNRRIVLLRSDLELTKPKHEASTARPPLHPGSQHHIWTELRSCLSFPSDQKQSAHRLLCPCSSWQEDLQGQEKSRSLLSPAQWLRGAAVRLGWAALTQGTHLLQCCVGARRCARGGRAQLMAVPAAGGSSAAGHWGADFRLQTETLQSSGF